MKTQMLFLLAAVFLATGCARIREQIGASPGTDYNVLTGGPVSGTTLADVPDAVRQVIQQRAPHGEVADIDKTTRDGKVIYQVSFARPGVNPKIFVTEDGTWVADALHLDRLRGGRAEEGAVAQSVD